MRIQGLLGSDIAMQLDVCAKASASRAELEAATLRTTRWAERCLSAKASGQGLFGIVQGGLDVELRLEHAEALGRLPFDGLALGGFSVGEPIEDMHRTLARVAPTLDARRPRYLMGVGTPSDIVRAIRAGVDMFDCVMPTRNARNGQAFVPSGRLVIKNARYRSDARPLDEACSCHACRAGYSRSYLRHLYVAGEILALRLLTLHNIHYYESLVAAARRAILEGRFAAWADASLAAWSEPTPLAAPSL
jgi:queuine tRNA-ribosyltransferase